MKKEKRRKNKIYIDTRCLQTARIFLVLLFSFFTLHFSYALDFGLILNQYGGFGNIVSEDAGFEYNGGFAPYFSAPVGVNGSFFLSAGITLNYNNADDSGLTVVPELLCTEFFTKFNLWELSAGRINYSDPLGLIVSGLFDGLRVTRASSAGHIGFGVYYTGLLYKKTANITMTADDKGVFDAEFKFDDFAGTYFAPRRLIASVDWEHPALAERIRLKTAFTGQFDFTDGNTKLHSQYLTLKTAIPAGSFLFEAGGSVSAMQTVAADTVFNLAFAGELGFHWMPKTNFNNRLSFTARYAGGEVGKTDDVISAFVPITTVYYGEIFHAKMSSLSVLGISYAARISNPLGISISALYFMRHDFITPNYYIITTPSNENYLLGAEIYGRAIWSPLSDVQFILGGGAFLPSLGNVWPDEKPKWRADLILAVSL